MNTVNNLDFLVNLAFIPMWLVFVHRVVPRSVPGNIVGGLGALMLMAAFYMLNGAMFSRWRAAYFFTSSYPAFNVWGVPLGLTEKLGVAAALAGALLIYVARRLASRIDVSAL